MKFFLILTALNQQQHIINNEKYIKEIWMIKRFVSATQVSNEVLLDSPSSQSTAAYYQQ